MKIQSGKIDFIRFLNRAYYISAHLAERLDEIRGFPSFVNYDQTISDTIDALELQISQIDKIFFLFNEVSSFSDCETLIAFLENLFTNVQTTENDGSRLYLLDYLSAADCLMKENAQIAELSLTQLQKADLQQYRIYNSDSLKVIRESLAGACSLI